MRDENAGNKRNRNRKKMKILLTNDDGIFAEGLWALFSVFKKRYDIVVVAPDRERSAVGHAITLDRPLRQRSVNVNGWGDGFAVSGTPADCVKLALSELSGTRPDLVISGINSGANVGININYSGTVAAAKEAALAGIPAIAASITGSSASHYEDAAVFVSHLAERVLENEMPFGTFLNVNIPDLPADKVRGIRVSRQSMQRFAEKFDRRFDPRNMAYYWYGGDQQIFEDMPDIDGNALSDACISVTPITCDATDYAMITTLKRWNLRAGDYNGKR